jgi:hypothetical protein
VVNVYVDVNWLRATALACGFGQQMKLRRVTQSGDGESWSIARVCRYISRYVTRDVLDKSIDSGVRVTEYFGSCRVCTTRFGWAGGFGRVWRAGVAAFVKSYHLIPRWCDFERVMRMGWSCFSEEAQLLLCWQSDSLFVWRYPERNPF